MLCKRLPTCTMIIQLLGTIAYFPSRDASYDSIRLDVLRYHGAGRYNSPTAYGDAL